MKYAMEIYRKNTAKVVLVPVDVNSSDPSHPQLLQMYRDAAAVLLSPSIAAYAQTHFAATTCRQLVTLPAAVDDMVGYINLLTFPPLCLVTFNEFADIANKLHGCTRIIEFSQYDASFDDDDLYYGPEGHPHVQSSSSSSSMSATYVGVLPCTSAATDIPAATALRTYGIEGVESAIVVDAESLGAGAGTGAPEMTCLVAHTPEELQLVLYVPPVMPAGIGFFPVVRDTSASAAAPQIPRDGCSIM